MSQIVEWALTKLLGEEVRTFNTSLSVADTKSRLRENMATPRSFRRIAGWANKGPIVGSIIGENFSLWRRPSLLHFPLTKPGYYYIGTIEEEGDRTLLRGRYRMVSIARAFWLMLSAFCLYIIAMSIFGTLNVLLIFFTSKISISELIVNAVVVILSAILLIAVLLLLRWAKKWDTRNRQEVFEFILKVCGDNN